MLRPSSAFLSVHFFQILLVVSLISYIPNPREVLYTPPPKFLLILLFCVLFGFFYIYLSFFSFTRLLFSLIISVLSIFQCHISRISTFFINMLLNYGDSLYIISVLLQGCYNISLLSNSKSIYYRFNRLNLTIFNQS